MRLALAVALAFFALAGCDKPAPPAYPLAEGAAEVADPGVELGLGTSLAALPVEQVATATQDGATARLAYDGARLLLELQGLPPATPECPVVAYLAQDAGGTRWEYRFTGGDPVTYLNGGLFGGKAPRSRVEGEVRRFYLPTLPGDFALQVVGPASPGAAECVHAPLIPAVTGRLTPQGGLTWAPAADPVVVGVRLAKDGPASTDAGRYSVGDALVLVGANLAQVDAARFGDTEAPATVLAPWAVQTTVAGGGDSETLAVRTPAGWTRGVRAPVDGTVARIGDAMGALSGAIWDTWLVVLLVGAGIILTVVNGFPQLRGFLHALRVVRGHYDKPDEKGEINHFQALTAALSATVGLGNIGGVAVAVTTGGPGAIFWMWVSGFLGMATKFSECTLSTAYREVRDDGTVAGGPMYYIKKGLGGVMTPVAFLYGLFITISSFGGGNMFQANQAAAIWEQSWGIPAWGTGLILVALVGATIIGGIKRIGRVTDKLVPTMCGLYVLAALLVIFTHIDMVPGLFASIFTEAFSVSAAIGGTLGVVIKDVLISGFRRASFSNEAGFGSAAIAHAAVKTDEPVREGVVALLEPFIDTIVICTMTALVILISGAWTQQGLDGVQLTAVAFDSAYVGFGSLLVPIAVFLFAVSTMISWSYYGEKGVEYVFGRRAIPIYRVLFVGLIFIGAIWKLGPVLDFSDAAFGVLAVPNIIAVLLLIPKLRTLVGDYFGRLRSGAMREYK